MKTRVLPLVVSWSVLLAQTPSFRVSTRLIQVSVIITDHHGKPVTGLKKEQFSVFDQGRQQEIVFFNEQVPHAPPCPPLRFYPRVR